jgi:hypothetical protein
MIEWRSKAPRFSTFLMNRLGNIVGSGIGRNLRAMPVELDERVRSFGTKVRLFPQAPYLGGFSDPEVVWLSPPAGTVAPGPSDDRIYVRDAVDKQEPYLFPYLPPFYGDIHRPVKPGPDGHFDHLVVGSRDFIAAHVYGSLRRVLDIFEGYLGQQIRWQFWDRFERLEVIPLIDWDNAQSGYGFMEFGLSRDETGTSSPFALNFDVIAHELGHSMLFSIMDIPFEGRRTPEYGAFHESSADLVALLAAMHFDSVLDRFLRSTKGNIYTLNEINRIAELSDTRQIRIASNGRKMSDVTNDVHDLSRPLTGAFFDALVYVFVEQLQQQGLIGPGLRQAILSPSRRFEEADWIQRQFDKIYVNRHFQFKAALMVSRDIIGQRLCATWKSLSPNDLSYSDVATAFLSAQSELGRDPYRAELTDIFHWRQIYETVSHVQT